MLLRYTLNSSVKEISSKTLSSTLTLGWSKINIKVWNPGNILAGRNADLEIWITKIFSESRAGHFPTTVATMQQFIPRIITRTQSRSGITCSFRNNISWRSYFCCIDFSFNNTIQFNKYTKNKNKINA